MVFVSLFLQDAKQLPTRTFQEKTAESSNQLRLQFPVSSGQLHRKTGQFHKFYSNEINFFIIYKYLI